MKKRNFIARMLAVLVIVPALLLCTACGGSQLETEAKINTSGNWEKAKTVTTAEYSQFANGLTEEKASLKDGFHVTVSAEAFGMKQYTNAYFLFGEDETKTQAAVSSKMESPAMVEGEDPFNMEMKFYMKDQHMYFENFNLGPYFELEEDLIYNIDMDLTKDYSSVVPGIDLSGTVAYLQSSLFDVSQQNNLTYVLGEFTDYIESESDYTIKKIENGKTVKYQFKYNKDEVAINGEEFDLFGIFDVNVVKYELYLIFEDGVFAGASMSMEGNLEMDTSSGKVTQTIKNSVTMVGFDREIRFPDFKDYTSFIKVAADIVEKQLDI